MGTSIIWFLLFALFTIVVPIGISPFEGPKVIIAEILIDLLALFTIVRWEKTKLKRLWSSQGVLLGIILTLSLDQLILFREFPSFFGNSFRLQGLFLFWHLILFSIISKDILISHIPKALYYLSFIFLFLATIILGVNQNDRAFGTLGEPNALAATTLFILPFVYFKSKKSIKVVVIATAFLIIFLSGSRAGIIGLGIEILFITLLGFLKLPLSKSIIISVILLLATLFLPIAEGGGWFENRSQIWQTALQAGLQSPILGQGFGNIQDPIHQASLKLNNPVQYQVVDSSHNFILDWWIQGGLVGLISIFVLMFLSLQGLIKHKKALELTAFLGLTAAMLFNPVSVVNLLAFWWLIGQGFSEE